MKQALLSVFFFFAVLNFSIAQNLADGWDGNGITGTNSKPNDVGWASTASNIPWNTANNTSGCRYRDYNVSGGHTGYTNEADGSTVTTRQFMLRWDATSYRSALYTYPVVLDANTTYELSFDHLLGGSASAPGVLTAGIGKTTDGSDMLISQDFPTTSSSTIYRHSSLIFTSEEAGTYYITYSGDKRAWFGLNNLMLSPFSSPDALLLSLDVSVGELSPTFSANIDTYTVDYPLGTSSVNISATPNPSDASVSGTGTFTLSDGAIATINVSASNGTQKSYQITFNEILPPTMAEGTGTLTTDGVWCWFQDPRAVYYEGQKKQTYSGWITSDGKIQVASYNHDTDEITQHTIRSGFQIDDHNNPTFLIRDDGRIMLSYSGHFYGPMRVLVSDNPEDITSWGNEATFGSSVTYANPYQIGNDIYMFYRDGSTWHPTIAISNDGGLSWGSPMELITRGGSQQRPYARYTQGSDGGVHIIFTDGHPRQEQSNKVYYVKFLDNKFYRADGTVIKDYTGPSTALDIDAGEPEVIYDASNGKGWTWDIALDENDNPVVLYAAFPDNNNHNYYYAYWNGSGWTNKHIVNSGRWFPMTPQGSNEPEPNYSGGMSLDPENTSIVYLSKQVNDVFEIYKYTTSDNGTTWATEALTENTPEDTLNVRPVVPRNHPAGIMDVLWLRGEYITYTNYHTAIMYYSPGEDTSGNEEINKFYDFGTDTSSLASGATRVSENSNLNGSYGWVDASGIASRDRGSSATTPEADFVFSSSAKEFQVNIPNGTYQVETTHGDISYAHDDFSIYANDVLKVSGISSNGGEFLTQTFEVDVTNETLVLRLQDDGGSDANWVWNTLKISNASSVSAKSGDVLEHQNGVAMFPNPTTNQLQVLLNKETLVGGTIDIRSLSGQTVLSVDRITTGKTMLNIGHLAPGVYSVHVYSNGQLIASKRLIKQ